MKFRKSQAAMEFLMTYGWAILVVLVAIGALAYFGVLNPAQFLPEKCTGPAGMDCLDKASIVAGATSVGYVELAVKNNLGFDITLKDATFPVAGTYPATGTGDFGTVQDNAGTPEVGGILAAQGAPGTTLTPAIVDAAGLSVPNGNIIKIRVYKSADIADGKFQGDLSLWYTNDDSGLDHVVTYAVTGRAG